ncbi:hypothetical protein TEK04_19630 [Klenkia sp. LSe6-5]|uniref:Uncharacterized protein n=1 Tax=Klenkia sesuvii TaxID=3103137 RepID=A0ABU8DZ23_9ACTN
MTTPATPVPLPTSPAEATLGVLVQAAIGLLTESQAMDSDRTGNGGRTPRVLAERANIFATLAVATALKESQTSSDTTAAAIAAAQGQLDALDRRIGVLERGRQTLAVATVDIGALVLGTRDITASWGKSLGDGNYQVDVVVDDVLLGRATATVKATTAETVTITVKTTLAVANATKLQLSAWRGV